MQDESKIYVESEDQPERLLLDTKIVKDDGYQKQQGEYHQYALGRSKSDSLVCNLDTLIVWTESNGIDMALSFQEAEGCAAIWYAPAFSPGGFQGRGDESSMERES